MIVLLVQQGALLPVEETRKTYLNRNKNGVQNLKNYFTLFSIPDICLRQYKFENIKKTRFLGIS